MENFRRLGAWEGEQKVGDITLTILLIWASLLDDTSWSSRKLWSNHHKPSAGLLRTLIARRID